MYTRPLPSSSRHSRRTPDTAQVLVRLLETTAEEYLVVGLLDRELAFPGTAQCSLVLPPGPSSLLLSALGHSPPRAESIMVACSLTSRLQLAIMQTTSTCYLYLRQSPAARLSKPGIILLPRTLAFSGRTLAQLSGAARSIAFRCFRADSQSALHTADVSRSEKGTC